MSDTIKSSPPPKPYEGKTVVGFSIVMRYVKDSGWAVHSGLAAFFQMARCM